MLSWCIVLKMWTHNAGECAIIRTRKYTCSESQPVTRDALIRRDCSSTPGTFSPCIFEYVYFARPDSVIDGVSVYKARLAMGEALARKIASDQELLDAIDVIIPVCVELGWDGVGCGHAVIIMWSTLGVGTGHVACCSVAGLGGAEEDVSRGVHQEPLCRPHLHHARPSRAVCVYQQGGWLCAPL